MQYTNEHTKARNTFKVVMQYTIKHIEVATAYATCISWNCGTYAAYNGHALVEIVVPYLVIELYKKLCMHVCFSKHIYKGEILQEFPSLIYFLLLIKNY